MLSIELQTRKDLGEIERLDKRGLDGVKTSVALAVYDSVAAHFRKLQAQPNANNYPKTNFWKDVLEATAWRTTPDGAAVSVAHVAFRQRLQGGTILPGAGKRYLTIPACAAAYGRTAGSTQMGGNPLHVQFMGRKGGRAVWALVESPMTTLRTITRGKNKGKLGPAASRQDRKVMYWLVPSVVQKPNPGVLPTFNELQRVAELAVTDHLTDLKANQTYKR